MLKVPFRVLAVSVCKMAITCPRSENHSSSFLLDLHVGRSTPTSDRKIGFGSSIVLFCSIILILVLVSIIVHPKVALSVLTFHDCGVYSSRITKWLFHIVIFPFPLGVNSIKQTATLGKTRSSFRGQIILLTQFESRNCFKTKDGFDLMVLHVNLLWYSFLKKWRFL